MTAQHQSGKLERFEYAVEDGRLVCAAFLFRSGRTVAAGRAPEGTSSFVFGAHEHVTEVAWSTAPGAPPALGGVRLRTPRRVFATPDLRTPALTIAHAPAGTVLVDVALRATPDGSAVAALEPRWGAPPLLPSEVATATTTTTTTTTDTATSTTTTTTTETATVAEVRRLLDGNAVAELHTFAKSQSRDAAALGRACAALKAAGERLRTATPAECPPEAMAALSARHSVLRALVLANIDLLRTEHPSPAVPAAAAAAAAAGGAGVGMSADEREVREGPPLAPLAPAESAKLCAVPFFLVPALDRRLALSVDGAFVHLALRQGDDDDDFDDDEDEEESKEEKDEEDSGILQRWVFTPEGEIVLADGTQSPRWRLAVRCGLRGAAELCLEDRRAAAASPSSRSSARWAVRGDRQTISARLDVPSPPPLSSLSPSSSSSEAAAPSAQAPAPPPMTEVERYYAAQERQRRTVWCLQAGPVLPGQDGRLALVANSTGDVDQQWFLMP